MHVFFLIGLILSSLFWKILGTDCKESLSLHDRNSNWSRHPQLQILHCAPSLDFCCFFQLFHNDYSFTGCYGQWTCFEM